ncbi:GntR family transcriptional regulator [Roseibium litorale]|uniref:GntR family transcriptional regulator n=1 Tax=Roseibium litorale TaxID=2803841 RepID=A0ABR9CJS6_9HYPH|nr:GntR family transcriptional regulator [Roseibium litorale]MBD8891110.1 GntR family transcriptional regulator [Roseibium litorale]
MEPRNKTTRVDNAYDRLKEEILSSQLPPGFQAPEPDIADRLGMSRTPVREALIRLEADGLVELIPRRGARILGLSPQDFRDIYELLLVLEPVAAGRLASQPLDTVCVEKLESILDAMEEASATGDLEAWIEADDMFHLTLARMSGNSRLAGYLESLVNQVRRGRLVLLRLMKAPVDGVEVHRELLSAILSRDVDAAREAARNHREEAHTALAAIFENFRLPQI